MIDEFPQSVTYDNQFAAYKSEIHLAENSLRYTRMYELKDVRVPVGGLGELKKFFRQIDDDERGYTSMKVPNG